ncbi:hypothetical protein [Amycolatopsis sp. NPDC098790]|uniref:hypothetical protein n=1 Tax=Amycolatopsis sp. NPDC098790 TaxID=3363939 RepID=UPI00380AB0FF
MDEDYARKLRAWLSAEPEATPRRAEEEREWLREVPAPQTDGGWTPADRPPGQAPAPASDERWTVRGRLPLEPVEELEEEWVCPVIALPLPRASDENGCRMSDPTERRSRTRRSPGAPAADRPGMADPAGRSSNVRLPREAAADWPGMADPAERSRNPRLPGDAAADQAGLVDPAERSRNSRLPGEVAADQADPAERSRNPRLPGEVAADRAGLVDRSRNMQLPDAPAADQLGVSGAAAAESRPRIRRGETAAGPSDQPRMSEAEARSRWNHPSNWHRRRREQHPEERPEAPGSR